MMKIPLSCFLSTASLFASLLLAATPTQAELIAEDDFSKYPVGAPPTAAFGGEGWDAKWHVGPDVEALIEMADGPDGTSQKCLKVSGGNTVRALIRRLASPEKYAGQPIYLRVTFQIENPAADKTPVFAAWLLADDRGHRSNLPAVTTTLGGTPTVRWGEESKNLPARIIPEKIHTLVAKLGGWNETAGAYTSLTYWLDPDPGNNEDAQPREVELSGEPDSKALALIFLRTHDLGEGFYRFFDVRLATTWQEALQSR